MNQLTEIYNIRLTKQQLDVLKKLADCKVNVSEFIRQSISEKLKRDWKVIKENNKKLKLPF